MKGEKHGNTVSLSLWAISKTNEGIYSSWGKETLCLWKVESVTWHNGKFSS